MASTVLSRNVSSSGNRKTFTFSAWLKRSGIGSDNYFVSQGTDSNNNWTILFDGNDRFQTWNYVGGFQFNLKTTRQFRDTNSWYHIMVVVDTTQATASDRVKIYINGTQETIFQSGEETYPSQDADMIVNSTTGSFYVGNYVQGSGHYNGSMSHVHFCDGTALAPTVFGSTDSTTGEWKINTSPSFTPGTNGFTILKDGNTYTDQSANSNNFSLSGTLTNTEDCPSNVFATANPLQQNSTILTFTNGNNTVAEPSGNSVNWTTRWGMSTLGFSSGKFYAEAKISDYGSGQLYPIGIVRDENIPNINSSVGSNGWGYYLLGGGAIIGNEDGTNLQTNIGSSTTGDIIGLAVDADNNTLQFYKNGSTLGTQVTNVTAGTYFFTSSAYANHGVQFNFGNGYFGTTAVSSAGTNASGIGIFEYDVPTGYTALSTKGLNL